MAVLAVSRDAPEERVLRAAEARLERGELIVFPTDTLYAVGGRALDPAVARAVRVAKARADDKPLPVVVADLEQVLALAAEVPPLLARVAAVFWPGPLTVVLAAAPQLPAEISAGTASVALRVPAAALVRRLCQSQGPLIATSANRSGEPPPTTCEQALLAVGDSVGLALDGGPAPTTAPSTIVDLRNGVPRLLRAGALPWPEVVRALGAITARIDQR